ncbi:glycosyl hydrolase family 18 protein [Clostridiaceae bacterium 35-E11]
MQKNTIYILVFCSFILFGMILAYFSDEAQPAFYTQDQPILMIQQSKQNAVYEDTDGLMRITEGDKIYLSLEVLSKHLNIDGIYDEDHNVAVITTKDKVIRFYQKKNKVKVNQEEVEDIAAMIVEDGKPFVPVNGLEDLLKVDCRWIKESNLILLKSQWDSKTIGNIAYDAIKLKKAPTFWSSAEVMLQKEEKVEILQEEGLWLQVLTEKGKIGYIQKTQINDKEEIKGLEQKKNEPIWKPKEGKIILTWEHVTGRNPDTNKIGALKGVNVISPTWIQLVEASGKIQHNISKDYIEWAKQRDYKIWVLASNSFDPDLTNAFLNNAVARETFINDLIRLVKENDMDGINIDFENVYLKNKDQLTQFVRELTPVFHENGLVVSMDVTVKSMSENWSMCYDRAALGKIVDYMAVMTYDEHWRTSPVSGSVASIPWVEKGIKTILEEVPEEKILLGVPFYTRIWVETPSKKEPNKMQVKSKAASMETIDEILKKNNIVKIWDDAAGQYYVAYIEENALHKIWIEDVKSMASRTGLISKYNLAGIGAWRRGFETEEIWEVIDGGVNKE